MGDVIATKDLVVEDKAMGINRKLFAGQPVPPDLVEAYKAEGGEVPEDYDPAAPQSAKPSEGQVVATRDVVVEDKAMGINRKLFKGQLVPADLHQAYADATGEDVPEPDTGESTDYESQPVEDLEAEAKRRGLEVEGTGANGNVLKADLVAALKADDES
jgi:hypothetical protein